MNQHGDTGGASRFFYCAKASQWERNRGMKGKRNLHPTVKPVGLMRYLVRLITPKQGNCVDPFGGSGTTGIGCKLEDINYVIIDREQEYTSDSELRLAAWQIGLEDDDQYNLFEMPPVETAKKQVP